MPIAAMTEQLAALGWNPTTLLVRGSPVLELSDIRSSTEELEDYYAQLQEAHITPAWIGGGIGVEPQSKAVPYLWHWRDLRPQAALWASVPRWWRRWCTSRHRFEPKFAT